MATPAILITVSYVAGIICEKFAQVPVQALLLSLALALTAAVLFTRSGRPAGMMVLLAISILGMLAYIYANIIPADDISHYADDRYVRIIGSVADEPSISDGNIRLTLNANRTNVRGSQYPVSGKVSVFIKGTEKRPGYGNIIMISGKLSKISSTSNPGISSYKDLMEGRNIRCQIFSTEKNIEVISRGIGNPIRFIAINIKNRLISVIRNAMLEPYSSLLGSIVFGSSASPMPDDLQEKYRTAGVIHLLVVSGTQVSIILSVMLNCCKLIGFPQKFTLIAMTMMNILFAVMVGAGPSIIRAAVMAEAALLAKAFERQNDFYNSLSLSALILLIFDPMGLFNIGFQLSFLATWALFYLAPALKEKLKNDLLSMSVAPTIATAPVILYNFGQVSFVSVIANICIVPWVEATVIFGFASTIIGLLFLPVAYVMNNSLMLALAFLNHMVGMFASLPFACRYFAPPNILMILIYYVSVVLGVGSMKGEFRMNKNIFASIAVIAAVAFVLGPSFASPKELAVTFIDVGQGDSILITSPSGKHMLIDGGGRQYKGKEDPAGKSIIVPYLRKQGIGNIDVLVLTHPHDDHVGGLTYVVQKIKVGLVLDSGQPHTSGGYYRFLKEIEGGKIAYKIAREGQKIDLGEGVIGYILAPSEPLMEGTKSDLNENSIVIRLVYGNTSFLFVGDAGVEEEARLLDSGQELKSDVLKVGHHGSRYSTSEKFLRAVDPGYAVISVGAKNKFGHPGMTILERLKKRNIRILRTDELGAVIMLSDGKSITVKQ